MILASAEEPAAAPKRRKYPVKNSGLPVARVGDEIITFRDLRGALTELRKRYPQPPSKAFDSVQDMEIRQRDAMLVGQALNGLINQSALIQEAKRHFKDKKLLDNAYEAADSSFNESEIGPLKRQYRVETEAQLKEKLADEGRSLDALRQSYRRGFLAHHYMEAKLKGRLSVELPDLLKYYDDHVHLHEFDRPAQITWREIVVEVDQHKLREDAEKKRSAARKGAARHRLRDAGTNRERRPGKLSQPGGPDADDSRQLRHQAGQRRARRNGDRPGQRRARRSGQLSHRQGRKPPARRARLV